MAESQEHKDIKAASSKWLKDNGCAIVVEEATTVGMKNLPNRPDVLALFTEARHPALPWRRWDVIEIESEATPIGVEAECRKVAARGPGYVSVANWTYLMHPNTFEPDVDTLKVLSDWGMLSCGDGRIDVYRPAIWTPCNPYTAIPLLGSMILNLQRETGRSAQEVRSGYGNRLSAKDTANLIAHLEEHPDDPIKAAARDCGIDIKKLRKAAKAGISGVKYNSTPPGTLVLERTP